MSVVRGGFRLDSNDPVPVPVTTKGSKRDDLRENQSRAILGDRLQALVSQAFELRETPYLPDACEAIVGEWQRRFLTGMERSASLSALLRGTR